MYWATISSLSSVSKMVLAALEPVKSGRISALTRPTVPYEECSFLRAVCYWGLQKEMLIDAKANRCKGSRVCCSPETETALLLFTGLVGKIYMGTVGPTPSSSTWSANRLCPIMHFSVMRNIHKKKKKSTQVLETMLLCSRIGFG